MGNLLSTIASDVMADHLSCLLFAIQDKQISKSSDINFRPINIKVYSTYFQTNRVIYLMHSDMVIIDPEHQVSELKSVL